MGGGSAAGGHAEVRFYAELNDHLPPDSRYRTLHRAFFAPGSVKDLIESFGVPHTEVELIVVNGNSVDFGYLVRDGDRVAVYPVFEALDVQGELRVRETPLRDLTFVLDVHLGKLAGYLRMLGFDTLYQNSAGDPELAAIAADQHRVLLTRDRGLLKRNAVTRGYWLRETDSRRQAAEVLARFQLRSAIRPFTRCMACNSPLVDAAKHEVVERLPPRVAASHQEFRRCPGCGRIYWAGSHYQRMLQWIEELRKATPSPKRPRRPK